MMRGLLVMIAMTFALAAHAQPVLDNAGYWMTRMLTAAEGVSFHGELVHAQSGHRVSAMQLIRRNGPEGYQERLLTLDGVPTEVFRDGKSVTCVLPHGRVSLEGRRVPRNPFPNSHWQYSAALHQHYDFLDLGEGRVAGRSCQVIGVQPKQPDRYGYRLWVDRETGMLLKADIIDQQGDTLEQVAFTRVDLGVDIPDQLLAATVSGETISWQVVPRREGSNADAWARAGLPPGFEFRGERERDAGVTQQVYSDGLASFSIFVSAPGVATDGLSGASHMGAISAFGTMIDGRQVTVVGELPVTTVEAVASSLTLRP